MRKSKRDNPYFRWGLTAFLALAAVIVVYVFLTHLSGFTVYLKALGRTLSPVAYGLAFAYLLCFPMSFFENLLRRPFRLAARDAAAAEDKKTDLRRKACRAVAILCTFLLVGLVCWAFFSLLLPRLADSIVTLVDNLDDYYSTVESWVMRVLDNNPGLVEYATTLLARFETFLTDFVNVTVMPQIQAILTSLTSSVIGVVVSLFDILIGFIIAVYVLYSKDTFLRQSKKLVRALFRDTRAYWIFDVGRHAHQYFGKFLTGKIIDSIIIGVLCFIGTSILRMPYALLISVIVGITNIIPFFGPLVGAIPSAFLVLMVDPLKCLYFIIFVLGLQQLDGNVIGPKILGDRINVSAFWIIVSILFFGKLLGFTGMVIGVPCFATVNYIVTTLVNRSLTARTLTDRQVAKDEYPDIPPDYNLSTQNVAGEASEL